VKIADATRNLTRVFLDTAPVIYYVEKNPQYIGAISPISDLIDNEAITAVLSPITLAECLVAPYRNNSTLLQGVSQPDNL